MLQTILSYIPEWVAIALILFGPTGAAAAFAAATPNTTDDMWVKKIYMFLKKITDLVGLNVFNAKNKDAE